MRQIKFRTWDKQNQEFSEWTNRDPFFSTSHGQIFFWERTTKEDGSYGGDVVLADTGDRFILQQFTGFLDKNNKEIYEGDIVFDGFYGPRTAKIVFDLGCFWLDSNHLHQDLKRELYDTNQANLKIIGNIFENPDLLRV